LWHIPSDLRPWNDKFFFYFPKIFSIQSWSQRFFWNLMDCHSIFYFVFFLKKRLLFLKDFFPILFSFFPSNLAILKTKNHQLILFAVNTEWTLACKFDLSILRVSMSFGQCFIWSACHFIHVFQNHCRDQIYLTVTSAAYIIGLL